MKKIAFISLLFLSATVFAKPTDAVENQISQFAERASAMLNSPDNVQTFSELKHLAIDKDQLADDILTYRKANAAEITPDEKLYLTTIFGELVSSAEGDMHRAVQGALKEITE